MLEALDRELAGSGAACVAAAGRLLRLARSSGVDAASCSSGRPAAGVTFVPGTDFGGAPSTAGWPSFVSPDEIHEGVERLAALAPAAPPH